ncbi:MAG: alpha/beta hydrolase [Verrucomicrobiota bacterium]
MPKIALVGALLAVCLRAQNALPDYATVEPNIAYDSYKETVLDIVKPKSANGGKRPGVLFIHGGGWTAGTKESVMQHFVLPYVQKGYVVANVEYRVANVALAPAAVTDVLKAAEWFRKNAGKYGVDDKRIIVSGGSAGGHLSLMVALATKQAALGPVGRVAAVVNFYGISDVADLLEGVNERKYAVTWLPESLADRRDIARRVSPQSWVSKNEPPVLTIHGDADPTVPYDHGVTITKMLRDAGNDAELISIPRGLHGDFMRNDKAAAIWVQIFDFLAKRKLTP